MAISGVDAYKQAILAQQYGQMFQAGQGAGAIGGTRPVTPEKATGVGIESESASPKFNWRSLNKFDGALTGTTPQTGFGKTSQIPSENFFATGIGTTGATQVAQAPQNNGLRAALNRIDAQDIGLNHNTNGLDGQRYINFLA